MSHDALTLALTTAFALCGVVFLFGRDSLRKQWQNKAPLLLWFGLWGLCFCIAAKLVFELISDHYLWRDLLIAFCLPLSGVLAYLVFTVSAKRGVAFLFRHALGLLLLAACLVLGVCGHPLWAGVFLAVIVLRAIWAPGAIEERRQLSNVLEEAAEALRQQLPLHDIFDALSREQHGRFAVELQDTAARLKDGAPLSVALDETGVVPPFALVAIRAGEAGGGRALPGILRGVAADLRAEAMARSALSTALVYPMAVWAVCLPIALFLVEYVIPYFGTILRVVGAAGQNPWWTVAVKVATAIVYASIVLLGAPVFLTVFEMPRKHRAVPALFANRWRAFLRCLQDRLPLFRARLRQRCLARCARAVGAMVECNVPLHEAFRQVALPELAGPFAAAFQYVAHATENGQPLPIALRQAGVPESFNALAHAGAAGGQFALAMNTAAEWHEARVRRLDRIMAVLLPCITIPMTGLAVGSLYFVVFGAMNAARSAVTP